MLNCSSRNIYECPEDGKSCILTRMSETDPITYACVCISVCVCVSVILLTLKMEERLSQQ